MSYETLKKAAEDALVRHMSPKLRIVMDDLIIQGFPLKDIRSLFVHTARAISMKVNSLTELSIQEYLDRVEGGEIIPTANEPVVIIDDSDSGINLAKMPEFDE